MDLSGGIVSSWPAERLQAVLRWVFEEGGHLTRLDCALDDRESSVQVERVKQAVEGGQCVTRAGRFQALYGASMADGAITGQTLYFGSPKSHTMLRVYDKRLEARSKGREDCEQFGVRWELELRKERANACGQALAALPASDWIEYVVSILRGYIDFRDTTREALSVERCRAPLLPWWFTLTEGFAKGRFVLEHAPRTIEDVKRWIRDSVAPMLAVACAAPEAGDAWLTRTIVDSTERWKDRHRRLARGNRGLVRATTVSPQPITQGGLRDNVAVTDSRVLKKASTIKAPYILKTHTNHTTTNNTGHTQGSTDDHL
ncbi:replication initiation factor domain-containing protein [Nitrospira japonica]|uniref:replication initiation factor domain-containing protein n=1 Tax=Nitrospira japonica TaxID=1325564 RepID=UPI0015608B30|nr:replication initiation factor domain-containing protein [Nitrospira japonica]